MFLDDCGAFRNAPYFSLLCGCLPKRFVVLDQFLVLSIFLGMLLTGIVLGVRMFPVIANV